jgi:hypothetical protein
MRSPSRLACSTTAFCPINYAELANQPFRSVAVREFPLDIGEAEYLLFGKAMGVVEAKHEGTTLSGVADQAALLLLFSFAKMLITSLS